jgi:DNA/RNA-binding domain of Phe-tRNA-synthetase-like protein/SAM-dependent methyltransferase
MGWRRLRVIEEPVEDWPGDFETGHSRIPPWEPPSVLQRWVPQSKHPESVALDLAGGAGRHSVYLSLLGWKVLAVDILEDALRMTRDTARRWSVDVETRRMDLSKEDPLEPGAFDLIVVVHFLERRILPRIAQALQPGGILIYETFARPQALKGRPRNPRYLLEPGELRRSFPDLNVLDYAEGADAAGDEVAVLVAQRPADPVEQESRKEDCLMTAEPTSQGPSISVTLDPGVRDRVTLGLLEMTDVNPKAPQDPIHEEIARLGGELQESYKEPSEASALLRPARDLYKALGLDPTRNRPSSEALFRRLVKGKGLYRVNAIVDVANLCSVEMFLPVGLYDVGKIRGPVLLRVGNAGESYEGIGKGSINVEGRWTLTDDEGPFGNPSSDSWRTRITEETRDILFVIFAPTGYDARAMDDRLSRCHERLRDFCGGSLVGMSVLS